MSVYISSLCLGHDLSRVRAARRLGGVLTGHGRSDAYLFVLGRGWLSFSLFKGGNDDDDHGYVGHVYAL